jgi:hypothetical protein
VVHFEISGLSVSARRGASGRTLFWKSIIGLIVLSAGVICLLAACGDAGGDFPRRQSAEKDADVGRTMRRLQVIVEHYAARHGGDHYPVAIDNAFKSYFPGGSEDDRTPSPVGMVNPFNGINEFPAMGSVTDIEKARNGASFPIKRGRIEYSVLDGGKSYAIVGGAHDGLALMDENDPGHVLVYSNR